MWHINLFKHNSRSFKLYKTGLEEHLNSFFQKVKNDLEDKFKMHIFDTVKVKTE